VAVARVKTVFSKVGGGDVVKDVVQGGDYGANGEREEV